MSTKRRNKSKRNEAPAAVTGTPYVPAPWEKILAAVVAVFIVLLVGFVCVYVIVLEKKIPKDIVQFLHVLLSLAVATLGATIPGRLGVNMRAKGIAVRAGGALGIFLLVFVLGQKPITSVMTSNASVMETERLALEATLATAGEKYAGGDYAAALRIYNEALRSPAMNQNAKQRKDITRKIESCEDQIYAAVMAVASNAHDRADLDAALPKYLEAAESAAARRDRDRYARAMNNAGLCYQRMRGTSQQEVTLNLNKAIAAFRDAKKAVSESKSRLAALVQLNLGNAYWHLSQHSEKPLNLKAAIEHYLLAVKAFPKTETPVEYSKCMNSLGVAYRDLARTQDVGSQLEYIAKSVEALEKALSVQTTPTDPLRADTAINLAVSYIDLAREKPLESEKLLARAKELLVEAETVYPVDGASRSDYARIQNTKGMMYRQWAAVRDSKHYRQDIGRHFREVNHLDSLGVPRELEQL